jgi:hypothetical protein
VESLELLDDGRDGKRLNLMLRCFLTCLPPSPSPSGASAALPELPPLNMLTAVDPLSPLSWGGGEQTAGRHRPWPVTTRWEDGKQWVAEAEADGGINWH